MKKIVWTFGLLAGAIIILLSAALLPVWKDSGNFQLGEIIGYATMIAALSAIFFGIRNFRDKHQDGLISFGKAFRIGLYITLIASAVYVIAWMIYSHTVATDFMEQYQTYMINQMEEYGKSQEEIGAAIEKMDTYKELYKNPLFRIAITFMEIFPVGLVISALSAWILKKK